MSRPLSALASQPILHPKMEEAALVIIEETTAILHSSYDQARRALRRDMVISTSTAMTPPASDRHGNARPRGSRRWCPPGCEGRGHRT